MTLDQWWPAVILGSVSYWKWLSKVKLYREKTESSFSESRLIWIL